jgi:type IV secretory pathway ATPase VirB11/archaellum biosynthesis ATPase
MGPLEALLGDPEVTRIFIPKPQVVLVERRGRTEVLAAIRDLAARAGPA